MLVFNTSDIRLATLRVVKMTSSNVGLSTDLKHVGEVTIFFISYTCNTSSNARLAWSHAKFIFRSPMIKLVFTCSELAALIIFSIELLHAYCMDCKCRKTTIFPFLWWIRRSYIQWDVKYRSQYQYVCDEEYHHGLSPWYRSISVGTMRFKARDGKMCRKECVIDLCLV